MTWVWIFSYGVGGFKPLRDLAFAHLLESPSQTEGPNNLKLL